VQLERLDSASSIDLQADVGAWSELEGSTVSSGQTSPVDAAIKSLSRYLVRILSLHLAEAVEAHHEEEDEDLMRMQHLFGKWSWS